MLKKPTTTDLTSSGTLVVSAVAGGLASNGVVSAIPKGSTKVKRIVLAVISIVLAAASNAKGMIYKIAQGAFAGMAITQITELAMEFISNKDEVVQGAGGSFLKGVSSRGMGMSDSINGRYESILRAKGAAPQNAPTASFRPQANASMSARELMAA
jgi:hypothetical protein